jgi:multicomponent Na+:H+ antiporter subunit D
VCCGNERYLNKISFEYFYQGAVGSVLILITFFSLFVAFGSSDIGVISKGMKVAVSGFEAGASLMFVLFGFGVVLKFFPFWTYIKNSKSVNFLSHFFAARFLFVGVNVGFYLILKILFFVFGASLVFAKFEIGLLVFIIASLLIFYGSVKLLGSGNFKNIVFSHCLIYIGFFVICISMNEYDSLVAAMFFVAHYSLVGLLLLLICSYMVCNYRDCNIRNLNFFRNANSSFGKGFIKKLSLFGMGFLSNLVVLLICAFPLTFLFLAYWHLFYVSLQSGYLMLSLVPCAMAFFVFSNLTIKMVGYFYFNLNERNLSAKVGDKQDYIYYLISFILIVGVVVLFGLTSNISSSIFEKLSLYLGGA